MRSRSFLITKKITMSVLIAAVSIILVVLFDWIAPLTLSKVNLFMTDQLFTQNTSSRGAINGNIVIVEIDDATLRDIEKGGLGKWQDFKRSYYAKVIDRLKEDGALVIGIDVLFSEKSNAGNDDEILRESIRKAGNVVLDFHYFNGIYPIESLKDGAFAIGDINPRINPANNTIYSWIAYYEKNQEVYESFPFAILRGYYENIYGSPIRIDGQSLANGGVLLRNDDMTFRKFIPLDRKITIPSGGFAGVNQHEFLINFPPSIDGFSRLSFAKVYAGGYDRSLVKDKIVLIGATATALHDEYISPIQNKGNGVISGVYFHALVLNTILNSDFIRHDSGLISVLVFVAFLLLISVFGTNLDNKNFFILSIFIFPTLFMLYYIWNFRIFNTILQNPVNFIMGMIIVFLCINIYKYWFEDQKRSLMKDALSQYVSKEVAETIESDFEVKLIEGIDREIVIFFSDIEGFTQISEGMQTKDLFGFIRDYLKEMSDLLIRCGGHINKYEGDAIMALWGEWSDQSEKSILACTSALQQLKRLDELNQAYESKYGFKIRIRIGINSGIAKIGNIGSEGKKLELTALGDNVNLGSRLEGINKYYGTSICVSESVMLEAKSAFVFRHLDDIRVKGRKTVERIFELVGANGEVSEGKLQELASFEEGLEAYKQGDFKAASRTFTKLEKTGDRPSGVFMERCRILMKNPPSSEWTGVWEYTEK